MKSLSSVTTKCLLLSAWLLISATLRPNPARCADGAAAKEFLAGADISYWPLFEKLGGVYKAHGQTGELPEIMKRAGCNTVRLRLFTRDPARPDPPPRNQLNDLEYMLPEARRVKKAGLKILLDFHYSDTWADPGKQAKPATWKALTFEQLVRKMHDYTYEVLVTMRREGVMPEAVQIGNEITPGMLWPDGKIGDGSDPKQNARFAALLQAGIRGAREAAAGGPPLRIVIHINNGASWPHVVRFYDILAAQGVTDYDAIGLSFYPMWGAKLAKLREVLNGAAKRFNKDIIIAETSFPWGPAQFPEKWKAAYRGEMEFPLTPEGQRQYTEALVREVKGTPGGHGLGIFWWGTEYLAPSDKIKGVSSDARSHVALFDAQANALPAMEALGKASQ